MYTFLCSFHSILEVHAKMLSLVLILQLIPVIVIAELDDSKTFEELHRDVLTGYKDTKAKIKAGKGGSGTGEQTWEVRETFCDLLCASFELQISVSILIIKYTDKLHLCHCKNLMILSIE